MKRLLWLVVIAVTSLAALGMLAPAWLRGPPLRSATHERLHLENVAGTLWNGSGDLVVATPRVVLAPGLHWSLAPAPLLRLHADGRLWQDGVSDAASAMGFSITRQTQAIRDAH